VDNLAEELNFTDALVQLTFTIQALLTSLATSSDLSLTQLRLLGILRDREPGVNELAAALRLDKSSVSGLVERAEHRGLVRRAHGSADRRAIRVLLTPGGRKAIQRVAGRVSTEIDALARDLSPADRTRLIGSIARMLEADRSSE
jgi:DNA-binding MarR family transcriptional regulator